MLAFVDHALGARVVRANGGSSASTIDLKIEWISDLPPAGPIEAVARNLPPRDGIVFAKTTLSGPDGPFARASGAFAVGILPGGKHQPLEIDSASALIEHPDFRSFTQASWEGEILVLPPLPHLVGGTEPPAFHGGALAGALHFAASDRTLARNEARQALTMAMRFLRPASALKPVHVSCEPERLGRRMATLKCRAEQDGQLLAVAEFIFWSGRNVVRPG